MIKPVLKTLTKVNWRWQWIDHGKTAGRPKTVFGKRYCGAGGCRLAALYPQTLETRKSIPHALIHRSAMGSGGFTATGRREWAVAKNYDVTDKITNLENGHGIDRQSVIGNRIVE